MEKFFRENIIISKIEVACYVAPGEGATVHKNRASHGLVFFVSREGEYVFDDGKRIVTTPDNILYLPKYSNYIVEGKKGNCFAINFQMQEEKEIPPFVFEIKNAGAFLDFFKHVELAWRTKKPGFEMKCMAELYQILYSMRKEYESGYITKKGAEIIVPAEKYIRNNYNTEMIQISKLAKMCNISETYFRKILQKVYGISPVKYINRLKILRAKELIQSGMYTISEVSQMAGYTDECYFSREFKKAVGVCPSEYREAK